MDKITLDFEQAKTKHLLFKSRLRSILYDAQVDEAPVLSHHECTVGKWIYNHAMKEYGHIPEMVELERVHADIHTSARQLVSLYKEGKVEEARSGLSSMEEVADHLVALLDTLEEKIKHDPKSDRNPALYQPIESIMNELHELAIANGKLDKLIKEQSGDLLNERKLLHDFFMQAPAALCILKGKNHEFELINKPYLEMIGNRDVLGKTFREVLPEVEGQGSVKLLDKVFQTQVTYIGREMPFIFKNGTEEKNVFLNFSYQAYTNKNGESEGILVFTYDVTEQVLARKVIEESEAKYKNIAEELKHSYDDLETKVKFRNIELERETRDLQRQIVELKLKNTSTSEEKKPD